MNDQRHIIFRISSLQFPRINSIYKHNSKFINRTLEVVVVIILTLLFNFFYEWNEKLVNISLLLLVSVLGFYIHSYWKFKMLHKKISESIPQFLSLLIMSMSMGKSLRYAFQKILERQKSSERVFYEEVFQKIFVLREQKSGFGVQHWDSLYDFLFEISLKSSHQLNSLRSFQKQQIAKAQNQRRKSALMLPVWIQAVVMLLLYTLVQLWNVYSGGFVLLDFIIVSAWYGLGMICLVHQQRFRNNKV